MTSNISGYIEMLKVCVFSQTQNDTSVYKTGCIFSVLTPNQAKNPH